jgi:phosphopantothenoylcysteine decarboxylase/phosphopantothenate--cysteine ligase
MSASKEPKGKLLLIVTGSIAAFKAASLASAAVKDGFEVRVALSEAALEFVGKATFEGLTGSPVHTSNFEDGRMMAHIDLERWADLIVVYPATAHTVSAMAGGLASSLAGALFLAHEFKKPWLLAPAMNQAMWKHPAIKENLSKLKLWGVDVLEPGIGTLACGETGEGRLMEPEEALEMIRRHFEVAEIVREQGLPRILVTAGGTSEPVDDVRHLANFSTGKTGYILAKALQDEGYPVTLLQSKYSGAFQGMQSLIRYSTTRDFAAKVREELGSRNYDFVIHAAAVADYHVEAVTDLSGAPVPLGGKIQGSTPLLLKLLPNPKIIQELRQWSLNPKLRIISFKLTIDDSTDLKLESYDSEWVIQNHLKDVGETEHRGVIYQRSPSGRYEAKSSFKTKPELVDSVISLISPESPPEAPGGMT